MPNLFGVQVSIIMESRGGHEFLATRGGHKSHIFRVPELRLLSFGYAYPSPGYTYPILGYTYPSLGYT